MAKEQITAETEISGRELAAILGKTNRRIQQLTADGILVTCGKGKYQIADAVQRYIRHAAGNPISEKRVQEAKARRIIEEARLKGAKATIEEKRADEISGKLHRSEDVREITEAMIYTIRSALAALPGRVSVDAFAAESAAEVSDIITKEVHKIMRELAEFRYDPVAYQEKVRERMRWEAESGQESESDGEDEDGDEA